MITPEFRLSDCRVEHKTMDSGAVVVVCWWAPGKIAVGHVLGSVKADDSQRMFESFYGVTHPGFRRKGIRTLLNDAIFDLLQVDSITTANGTDEGGMAWMMARSYKRDPARNFLYVTRELWEHHKKKNPSWNKV